MIERNLSKEALEHIAREVEFLSKQALLVVLATEGWNDVDIALFFNRANTYGGILGMLQSVLTKEIKDE